MFGSWEMLTIYTNHPGGNLVHRYKTIENFQRDYNVHCLLLKIWHNRCLRFLLGRLWLRGEKLETMVMKNWRGGGGRGGHTMCIIMVSVKMVNKISRSLRTNCYKLYPNRLNRLPRVQKLLRLKSSLKNDTNNRNVQFSQVNCKLDRCSTLSKSFWHFKEQEEIKSRA